MRTLAFFLLHSFLVVKALACDPPELKLEHLENIPSYITMPSKDQVYQLISFIEKEHTEVKDETYAALVNTAKSKVDLEALYNCFQPFLQSAFPERDASTTKTLNKLDTAMHAFVYTFDNFFFSLLHGRAEDANTGLSQALTMDSIYEAEMRPLFHIAQGLGNRFVEIMQHYNYNQYDFTKDYGVFIPQQAKPVGYLKDCNGFLLFPMPLESTYQIAEILYGEPRIGLTRRVLYKGDQIITQSGFVASWEGEGPFPLQVWGISGAHQVDSFFRSAGALHYVGIVGPSTPNSTAEELPIGPFNSNTNDTNRQQRFLEVLLDLKKLKKPNIAFAPIPETPEDYNFIQILLLEDLINQRKNTIGDEQLMICDQIQAIETEVQKPIETYLAEQKEGLINKFEEKIQSEQEVSNPVVVEKVATKKKAKKGQSKKYNKKQKQAVQPKKLSKEAIRKQAESEASKFMVEGRQKWRHVLKLVNEIAKKYPALRQANVNITGSHITLHEQGKESITIAPKHGGQDLTLPAGTVNNFVGKLLKFAFQAD